MAYSETRIVIGGLAHVIVLIFLQSILLKLSWELKPKRSQIMYFMKSQLKLLRKRYRSKKKVEAIKILRNKLDNIEQKTDEFMKR